MDNDNPLTRDEYRKQFGRVQPSDLPANLRRPRRNVRRRLPRLGPLLQEALKEVGVSQKRAS
jgi:hypothetical protein